MSIYDQQRQRSFKPNWSKLRTDDYGDEQAQQKQQGWEMAGNVAKTALPAIGGVLGAIGGSIVPGVGTMAGAGLGTTLGGAVGNVAGGALHNVGEQELDPIRRRELRRLALQQAIAGMR